MKGNRFSSKLLASALCVLTAGAAAAQTAPEEIADCPERAAGVYHSYEYRPAEAEPVPEGYVPFYISHYGRHGSRYHSSEAHYTAPLVPLREAAAAGTLTAAGRAVLAKGEALAADAAGRYGDLSPRGVREHRRSPNACMRPIPRYSRRRTAANAGWRAVRRSCRAAS